MSKRFKVLLTLSLFQIASVFVQVAKGNAFPIEEKIYSYLVENKKTASVNFDTRNQKSLSYFMATKVAKFYNIPEKSIQECQSTNVNIGLDFIDSQAPEHLLYETPTLKITCSKSTSQAENGWVYLPVNGLEGVSIGYYGTQVPLQLVSFVNFFIHKLLFTRPPSSSGLQKDNTYQRKFYFLVGYVDMTNTSYISFVKASLKSHFSNIQERGYAFEFIPNATINDLIGALNDKHAISIYWLSHSLQGENVYHLVDYNMSKIPLSFFERKFEAPLINLTLVTCYPEKLVRSYGLNSISKLYGFNLYYSEGANDLQQPGVVDSRELMSFIHSLPAVYGFFASDQVQKVYYTLEFDLADHFPNSTNYFIYFNGSLISEIPHNSKSGYERIRVPIRVPVDPVRNQLKIVPETTATTTMGSSRAPIDDILIKNISISNLYGKTLLPETHGDFHMGNDDLNIDLKDGLLMNYGADFWRDTQLIKGLLRIDFRQVL